MKHSEAFNLIRSFKKEDFADFRKYLASPFFNNVKALAFVFKIISGKKGLLDSFQYIRIKEHISDKTGFSDNTVNKLLSYLSKKIIDYYSIKSVVREECYMDLKLNQYLLNVSMFSLLGKKQKLLSEKLSGNKISENSYLFLFKHYDNITDALVTNKNKPKEKTAGAKFDSIVKATISAYIDALMKITSNFVNYKLLSIDTDYVKKEKYPVDVKKLFDALGNKNIAFNDNSVNIIYELYLKLLNMFINYENDEYYNDYKIFLNENINILDNNLKIAHHSILMNYCTSKERMTVRNKDFRSEGLNLLKEFIEKEYYKNTGVEYLHPALFRNFIIKCIASNEFSYLKNFIDNNQNKLSPEDRDNIVNYGKSLYYYGIKNHKKCLKHINDIDISNFMFKYDVRNLELKLYFDMNKNDLLEKAYHNYREIVKKDVFFTTLDKLRYKRLFFYFSKLILLNNKSKKANTTFDAEYLLNKISKEESFVLKNWVVEKLNSLIDV